MKIVRPMTVNDANLLSSNVAEDDYAAYNAGTTYGLSERVILVSPSATVTMTIANPGVISWTAHGLPDDTPIVFTTTGALPTGIVAGTRYFIRDAATNTFRVCAKVGGPAIITTGSQSGTHTATAQIHKVYESLQASNTGNYPPSSDTWWLDCGSTNRWKMFDTSVTSQSSAADSLEVSLEATGRVNTVALLNVSAATARVVMTDDVDGVIYDETKTLSSDSGITDWYAYFFEPIVRATDALFSDLPPYADAQIDITLTDTGNAVLCGAALAGLAREIGGTQYGASFGIQDYSVKQRNDFGDYTILERAFNKRGVWAVFVDNDIVDELAKILAEYRATPTLYIGSDDFTSMYIFGFFKDFSIAIAYPEHSICNLELEGLT
jgi:hypothetical protein